MREEERETKIEMYERERERERERVHEIKYIHNRQVNLFKR
jgi:hypothetical protein